jgi:hypothetical protein
MHEEHTNVIDTQDGENGTHDVTPQTSERVSEVTTTSAPRANVEHYDTAPRTSVDRYETLAYDPYAGRRQVAYRLTQLIYWVFALVDGLIVIRLILKALGANPSAEFSQFIYGVTAPLVAPFAGLFTNPTYQNGVLELGSIVALIVYALIAWLLAKLVWIVVGENRSAMRTHSTQTDSRI